MRSVIEGVVGGRSGEQIAWELKQEFGVVLSDVHLEQAISRATSALKPMVADNAKRRQGIVWHKLILRPQLVDGLADRLLPLYRPVFAHASAAVALIGLLLPFYCMVFLPTGSGHGLDVRSSIAGALLFMLLLIAHEFGHAAALRRFGLATGGIGVGVLVVVPFLYTEVTGAWVLPPKKRILVDMSGLYMQGLAQLPLAAMYLHYQSQLLATTLSLTVASTILTINPFFRSDGYWALSDWLNVRSLRDMSYSTLLNMKCIRRPHQVVLAVYAIGDVAFVAFIISCSATAIIRVAGDPLSTSTLLFGIPACAGLALGGASLIQRAGSAISQRAARG